MPAHNPSQVHEGPSRHGGVGTTNTNAVLASVVAVDATRYTYHVRTLGGSNLTVPRKRHTQDDLSLLAVGATVIVRFDIGLPYIDGVLDVPSATETGPGIPTTGVDGFGGFTDSYQAGGYRGAGEPTDTLPGDTLWGNKDGVRLGALTGGVALMMASALSQIRFHQLNDLVELFSRNYKHVSDMGFTKIENKNGKINLSFRGASEQAGEAGSDEENWTIRLDLGSEGDLFRFELTTPQGQTLFSMHVDGDGRCSIFGADGVILQSGNRNGEPHETEQGGDSIDTVHGNRTVVTGGEEAQTVQGSATRTIDGNDTRMCGNDVVDAAARDYGLSSGRNMTVTAAGDKRGNNAFSLNLPGGGYKALVGSPTYTSPAYDVETYGGKVRFSSRLGGNIEFETLRGQLKGKANKVIFDTSSVDSCILGGTTLRSHVAKYEQLESLVRAMFQHFDTHTHPTPSGASGAPVVPMTTILMQLLLACKSQRVGVGG